MNRRTILVIGIVLGFVATPIAGSLISSNAPPTSGTIPLNAVNGPQIDVTGATNITMDSTTWPDDNTVVVQTNSGNVTFEASGTANASITAGNITGSHTTVTNLDVATNELYVNPEDKPAINVSGSTDWLEFREMAVDDGSVDFIYAGATGSTTLTVRGVASNSNIGAIDASGTLLATGKSDGSGVVTLPNMPNSQHAVKLVTSDGAPSASNPRPTGGLSNPPQNLKVDISDADFPQDNVTVTFRLDGGVVGSDTVDTAGTASTSINGGSLTAGEHSWSVRMEDRYGRVATANYSFKIPDTLYIRNETSGNLITSPTNVTVTFFAENGSIVKRNTSDGTINMTGLPANQEFEIRSEADGYFTRSAIIESLYDQQTIYLLSKNASSVEVRFTLTDRTGRFGSEETTLYIEKPITNGSTTTWKTIVGSSFGVQGVTTTLEEGESYRLRVENDANEVRYLGTYTASVSETVELTVGALEINYNDTETEWLFTATKENSTIVADYSDPENKTSSIDLSICQQGNSSNCLVNTTLNSGPYGNASYVQPLSATENNTTWVVSIEATRDGSTVTSEVVIGPQISVGGDIPTWIRNSIAILITFMVAGLFSQLNVAAGGVTTAISAGFFWYISWLPGVTSGIFIASAIAISFGYRGIQAR